MQRKRAKIRNTCLGDNGWNVVRTWWFTDVWGTRRLANLPSGDAKQKTKNSGRRNRYKTVEWGGGIGRKPVSCVVRKQENQEYCIREEIARDCFIKGSKCSATSGRWEQAFRFTVDEAFPGFLYNWRVSTLSLHEVVAGDGNAPAAPAAKWRALQQFSGIVSVVKLFREFGFDWWEWRDSYHEAYRKNWKRMRGTSEERHNRPRDMKLKSRENCPS